MLAKVSPFHIAIIAYLSLPVSVHGQTQSPNGLIVPFTSVLPACASLCGPLFDVQGACTPPNIAAISQSCFCSDSRLKPFLERGTSGVEQVCGSVSCQDAPDLQKIQSWYEGYCGDSTSGSTTTVASTSTPTATGSTTQTLAAGQSTPASSPQNQSWISTHYKWIIFLVVLIFGLGAVWIGAIFLRRYCVRKHEGQYEMRSSVAWGPHQLQGTTGGLNDKANYGQARTGPSKEAMALARTLEANPIPERPKRKSWFGGR